MSAISPHAPTVTSVPQQGWTLASRGGRLMVFAILAALAALRVLMVLHYRVDSDEPQHLHVVWGWTHGLLQYRDVFDNHTPLFHLLCVPLLRWVGERPDSLIFMRFAMVPLFAVSVFCIYRIGTLIKSPEVGFWAAVFAALSPALAFTSTEYRTDDLWASLWFLSLLVLLAGEANWKRGLAAGLLIGAAIATSLKTLALLGCLGAAAIVGLLLTGGMRPAMRKGRSYLFLGALLVGSLVLPSALAWWFARQGAWRDALFGIFTYNSVSGLGRLRTQHEIGIGVLEMAGAAALLIPFSHRMAQRLIAPALRLRFHLVFLGSGLYGALVYTLWPLLDAEHLIPFHPLFITGLMPLLVEALASIATPRREWLRSAAPAAAAIAIMAAEAWHVRVNAAAWFTEHITDLLRLSEPTDYVMDLKGETIFRPRPCWYLFEGVGIARAQRGMVPDDVPEQMIATRTCITIRSNYRFVSPRTLAFLDDNYIAVGGYRVLGHAMTPTKEPQTYTFEVVIPATFAFFAGDRVIGGTIDGQRTHGFATLARGRHTFVSKNPQSMVDFVWKQAIDRGFDPKHSGHFRSSPSLRNFQNQST